VNKLEKFQDKIRAARITQAKRCAAQAERYTSTRPGGTATEIVRDLHLAIKDLIEELEHQPATGATK
jgi:hypothetical protein